MSDTYSMDNIENLSVADILGLTTAQIEVPVGFQPVPKGAYAGVLMMTTMPDPSQNQNQWKLKVRIDSVIELEDPEQMEAANTQLEGGVETNCGYNTPKGVPYLIKDWGNLIDAVAQGSLATFFGATAEGALEAPLPITFMVSHRIGQPRRDASPAEKAAFEPKTYMDIAEVQYAG